MHDIVSNTADLAIVLFFGSMVCACLLNAAYYVLTGMSGD